MSGAVGQPVCAPAMSMKEFFQSKKTLREHSNDALGLLPGQGPQYCPSMTWKQRLYGFGICLGAGVLWCVVCAPPCLCVCGPR